MKTAIIGLDSVPPELLFDKLLDKLPNSKRFYDQGLHGKLRTCDPPITVPAWMVMMTGKSPGELGIYGFKHRKGFSYTDGYIVTSTNVRVATLHEWASPGCAPIGLVASSCPTITLWIGLGRQPTALGTTPFVGSEVGPR